MHALEHLSIMVALLLAVVAALISSDPEARQEVASLFADGLGVQTANIDGDPGYLLGTLPDESPQPVSRLDRLVFQHGAAARSN